MHRIVNEKLYLFSIYAVNVEPGALDVINTVPRNTIFILKYLPELSKVLFCNIYSCLKSLRSYTKNINLYKSKFAIIICSIIIIT